MYRRDALPSEKHNLCYLELDTTQSPKDPLFIVLVSEESIKSKWCKKECELAFEKKKSILPVYLPDFEAIKPEVELSKLHIYLGSRQAVDLRQGYSESKISAHLWKAINQHLFFSGTSLSRVERTLLVNQFENLDKSNPDQGYDIAAKIFARGFELHYDLVTQTIDSEVMSEAECQEVLDILTMFDFMDHYIKSGGQSDIDENVVKNIGFDGNYNAKYREYLQFLVEDEERFPWLNYAKKFNTHSPMLEVYRRMLIEYNKSRTPHQLTKDDVIRIISAQKYPN